MAHKNAVAHSLAWRKKNTEVYREYMKNKMYELRHETEFDKFWKQLRKINVF